MREVSLFIATSLDGFVARPDGKVDWLFQDANYGFSAFYANVDLLLMGRKTFEAASAATPWPYPGKSAIVFSRSLKQSKVAEATVLASDPVAEIRRLRATHGKKMWLVGGPALVASLLAADVVDEMVLSVHPILIGQGVPLFGRGAIDRRWKLVGNRTFQSGLLQTTYFRADSRRAPCYTARHERFEYSYDSAGRCAGGPANSGRDGARHSECHRVR
jgi:dihydrofolate reductase